ncbi:hypothetical protein BC938DRAFT_473861 [Jimgerdemannia flammicorona]|uniref:Inhibitor of Apoptosis domain-containing protein n=1 Tax=Jimgerdemannia flammicorona TaxID=994334 RepID=A0A433Q381_9FUNG|nr:hypothetical protein BC938DRAFT_473861 [Jimgerdemannia flammicorona]
MAGSLTTTLSSSTLHTLPRAPGVCSGSPRLPSLRLATRGQGRLRGIVGEEGQLSFHVLQMHPAMVLAKMAEGGFHFSPLPDSNDDAACAYCGLHLDGWTPGDDPIQEHRKREASCQFFVDLASLTATTTAVTVTSVPVAPPTKAPRGRRKKAEKPMNKDVADREEMDIDIDMDAQTDAGSVLDVEVEQEPERETRPVRGKSAAVEKKASAARRGRPARKEQEAAATEVETDLEVDTVAEEPRKKSSLEDDDLVSIADTDTESIAGGRKKRTRGTGKAPGRGKSAVADIDDDDAFSIMDADNSSEVSSLVNAPSRKESVGSVASVMTIAESVVSEAEPRRRGRKPKGGAMKAAAKTKGARTKVDEVDESETTTQDGAMDMADAASDAGGTQDATKTTDNLRNLDRMPFISVPVNPVPLTATRNPSLVSFRSFPTLPTTNVPPSLARRIEPILSTTLTKSGPPQPIILTEAEWNMTVQEYMDHLVEKQVERLDGEGRRMMGVFVGEAEKVARAISQRR